MIRRVIIAGLALVVLAGATLLVASKVRKVAEPTYWIELDNAFDLTKGADFKVGGVKAGKIVKEKVDLKSHKALIGVAVTQIGIPVFHKNAHCVSRPQSLIGEYFVDCQPGAGGPRLPKGAIIPVAQTESTIPADLLTDVMRLPYRERLRLLLTELGVGVAGRGQDLNAALRRAVPAIRETDRVLALLASQRTVLRNLTRDSNTDLSALADNRKDVARFVVTARRTAEASAMRRTQLADTFRRFPAFLEQLRPAMVDLGSAADAQVPTLINLNASAGQLKRFFSDLAPFANASRPAFRSLGQTSVTGRQSVAASIPTVGLVRRFARQTPEVAKNLRIILRDLDDRRRAVERDPRSPGGKGYTGLEALLQYTFDQSMAINPFDRNSYMLRVALIQKSACAPYRDANSRRNNPMLNRGQCDSQLGPNQPGINAPDPSHRVANVTGSPSPAKGASARRARSARPGSAGASLPATPAPAAPKAGGDQSGALLNYLLSP